MGEIYEVQGITYYIETWNRSGGRLKLAQVDKPDNILELSVNEFGGLLAMEEAIPTYLILPQDFEELEIPDEDNNQIPSENPDEEVHLKEQVMDISHAGIVTAVAWQGKMYLIKCMLSLRGMSPKNKVFAREFERVHKNLQLVYAACLNPYGRSWSAWTIYHLLLPIWTRKNVVALAHRKGVEYVPWQSTDAARFRQIAAAARILKVNNPFDSISNIREKVNAGLKKGEI